MKPSGIEWIGDIPEDWEVKKVKRLFSYQKGKNAALLTKEYISLHPGEYPVLSGQTENDGILGYYESYEFDLDKDSIFVTTVGAKAMSTKLVNAKFSLSQNCALLHKIDEKADVRFLHYALFPMFEWQKSMISLIMQPSLRFEDLDKATLPYPPLKTQERIADYLDKKCGEIDATISKQKESIEKLKAYKQSLISETVTKGLDKSAPLKPSGIEWIGDIPDDWEVTKISRLYSIQLGKMLQPEKKSSGDTYEPYICAANLSSGTFRLDEVKYMWISEPEKDIYRLKRDDLLVTEGGDVGISSIWKDDISPCYFQNALHRVVPKKGNSNRFLHYWLIVLKSVGYIDLICNKSTIAHFTKEKFAQSLILSIPLQTQGKIADYLDSKCSQIDKYITEKQNIIQKLDAYKKSLIFECVTGKQKILGIR